MSDEVNATEAAIEFAKEHGLDLSAVTGTGADGRITKGDVTAYLAAQQAGEQPTTDAEMDAALGFGPVGTQVPGPAAPVLGGTFTTAGAESDPAAVERAHALATDVTAYMRPDPVAVEIMALPNLGAVINWAGDREAYQAVLQARAKELLGKA